MDATLAISEPAVNKILHKFITTPIPPQSGGGTWGPFYASYSVSVALAGGNAVLVNAPVNRVDLNNVNISGNVGASVGFDLGLILPHICIPPFQICVHIPFVGTICTPQYCITWPHVGVNINLPFALNASAEFGFQVDNRPTEWALVLDILPLTLQIDLSPMRQVILTAVQNEVTQVLGSIPLIGGLIAGLVNTVLAALSLLLDPILLAISALINVTLTTLNTIFNVSIPIEITTVSKTLPIIPAGLPAPGDPEVDVTVALLTAQILDKEIVAEAQFA